MSTYVTWTHGNALVVEDPGEYSSIRHRGWGIELNYNPFPANDSDRVSHIPLPTPATVDGVAPTLVKVMILFETTPNVIVGRVDVWDANNLVTSFYNHGGFEPAVGLWVGTGSHLTLDRNNQLPLPQPHEVSAGIGLSFACKIFDVPPLQMNLAAVGGQFVEPSRPSVPPPVRRRV